VFKLDKSVDVAAQEVRDKVNQILPDLPQDIDQPWWRNWIPTRRR